MPAKRGGKRGGIANSKKKEKLLKDQEGSKKKLTGSVEAKAQEVRQIFLSVQLDAYACSFLNLEVMPKASFQLSPVT